MRARLVVPLLSVLAASCAPVEPSAARPVAVDDGKNDGFDGFDADDGPEPGADVVSTRLEVDVAERRGRATIEVVAGFDGLASFDVSGLDVRAVAGLDGELAHSLEDGRLEVRDVPPGEPVTLVVDYGYSLREGFEGATTNGLTFTWPYYCGNLFPCRPDPADGVVFELTLVGEAEGLRAIHPASLSEAPPYMLAWAIGDYVQSDLGVTAAGTRISVYHRPDEEAAALRGTAYLADAFEWLEATYGPYAYGDEAASVSVTWGPGAYGGMEHHPYWHVSAADLGNPEVHVHEAAHGWFGNAVRIRCWEDFVLSEGTTSYVTARAIAEVGGPEAAASTWEDYRRRLAWAQRSARLLTAWPDSCGRIDVLDDGLFSSVPYMKGAFFLRAVAAEVGEDDLDRALASFYAERAGSAAGMQDLLETIRAETGYDPTPCAAAWLRSEQLPAEDACRPAEPTP